MQVNLARPNWAPSPMFAPQGSPQGSAQMNPQINSQMNPQVNSQVPQQLPGGMWNLPRPQPGQGFLQCKSLIYFLGLFCRHESNKFCRKGAYRQSKIADTPDGPRPGPIDQVPQLPKFTLAAKRKAFR